MNYQRKQKEQIAIFFYLFRPNKITDVPNLFQNKASKDMNIIEFRELGCTSRQTKYQPLTIDMSKELYQGKY